MSSHRPSAFFAFVGGLVACSEKPITGGADYLIGDSSVSDASSGDALMSEASTVGSPDATATDSGLDADGGSAFGACGATAGTSDVDIEVVGAHGSGWAIPKEGRVADGTHALVSFRIHGILSGPVVTPYSLGKVRGHLEISGSSYKSLLEHVSGASLASIFQAVPGGSPEFVEKLSDSAGSLFKIPATSPPYLTCTSDCLLGLEFTPSCPAIAPTTKGGTYFVGSDSGRFCFRNKAKVLGSVVALTSPGYVFVDTEMCFL